MAGPLAEVRIIELAGRSPGPFGAMILSDLGADVVRVLRAQDVAAAEAADGESATQRMIRGRRTIDLVTRGRRSIALDLKHADGHAAVLRLID